MSNKQLDGHLSGRVAVVTGAGQSIGRAHALRLASEGAKVVVNDVGAELGGTGADRSRAEAVAQEIVASGGVAVANTDSVASMAGAEHIIECAVDSFGRIDILINNAGNLRPNRIFEATEEDFDLTIAVHLKGAFGTTRFAAPHFRDQRGGVIVNTGSDSGLGHYGHSVYALAKEGLAGFTRSVARDLGPYNVRCNLIRPGALSRQATHDKTIALHVEAENEFNFPAAAEFWLTKSAPGQVKTDDMMMYVPQMVAEHVADFTTWLCTDAASEINGMSFRVMGGEIGLMSDPHVTRALFRNERWDIKSLNDPAIAGYLCRDLKNRFRPG